MCEHAVSTLRLIEHSCLRIQLRTNKKKKKAYTVICTIETDESL